MNTQRTLLWIALAALGFSASHARAQDEFVDESAPAPIPHYQNWIELGIGDTSDGNGKFGEYTSGVNDLYRQDGIQGVGSFRLGDTDPASAEDWSVQGGTGFGRLLEAQYTIQGDWGVSLFADRVDKVEYGDALTVFPGGGTTLTLPTTFIRGSRGSPSDPASYGERDIVSERKLFGLEGFKYLGRDWKLSVDYRDQQKDGDDIIAGNQGFGGTSLVPEPLDYSIHELTTRADYATGTLQTGVEVFYSEFSHGNDTLSFQNPSVADTRLNYEQLDLEPDNEFLRFGIDGGLNFGATNRLSWFLNWSRGEQDDNFVRPYLSDTYYGRAPLPLAASSLDGEVERTAIKLALAGAPVARFDYRLTVDYKDKDATHDPALFQSIGYSSAGLDYDTTSKIYDKQSTTYALDGGYRFGMGTRLRAGVAYETIDRDTDEIEYVGVGIPAIPIDFSDSTDEDRYWAELRLPRLGPLAVKLRGEYGDRSADLSSERQAHIDELINGLPIRATPYFLLDRTREKYVVDADLPINDALSLSASWQTYEDDFDNDSNGMRNRDAEIWNAAITWSPTKLLSTSAYLSIEEYEIHQDGRVYSPPSSSTPTLFTDSDWKLDSEDRGDGFGVNVDWIVIETKLDVAMDLAYLDYESDYQSVETVRRGTNDPGAGNSLPSEDKVTRFTLRADYHYTAQLDFSGRFVYEHRDAQGWSWDPTLIPGVQTLASTLAFGWEEPDYESSLVVFSVRYKY